MKNPDEAINAVLGGMKNTEVPPGLERRVARALEQRASSRPQTPRSRRTVSIALACGLSIATTLALVLTLSTRHHAVPTPAQSALTIEPSPRLPPAAASSTPIRLTSLHAALPSSPRPKPRMPAIKLVRDDGSQAASDTRAPSQPAPPLPLTTQEKLLLRLAHHEPPEELAMLSPAVLSQRVTEQNEEFQKFFEPPTAATKE